MRTLVIWDECLASPQFFIVEEDWSKYNNVYINGESNEELLKEFSNKIYDENYNHRYELLNFPLYNPTTDLIIVCGCLP